MAETERWIPASEKLPDKVNKYYLVTYRYTIYGCFEYGVAISYLQALPSGNKKWEIEEEHEYWTVTAWMPLPDPYSAEVEKPQTNADRIRSMTNEELVSVIVCPDSVTGEDTDCNQYHDCKECTLDWLQKESEE